MLSPAICSAIEYTGKIVAATSRELFFAWSSLPQLKKLKLATSKSVKIVTFLNEFVIIFVMYTP